MSLGTVSDGAIIERRHTSVPFFHGSQRHMDISRRCYYDGRHTAADGTHESGKEPELSSDKVVRTHRTIIQRRTPQVSAKQAAAA
jgi:hypothetical protein